MIASSPTTIFAILKELNILDPGGRSTSKERTLGPVLEGSENCIEGFMGGLNSPMSNVNSPRPPLDGRLTAENSPTRGGVSSPA